ncbi:hypothetical protein Pla22_30810 [Rubripirellula amarantea]|uniref:Uncharacterized protein n=1 Tax=Rubripirellula amarantea TaxID=2527999 RepID=A0A5C5WJM3_9BACT|nr:hypothetical protein [Rubripirellula amarantea]TWT50339.1 hypothetical protein Pla22_30810 [Rubripirellula amarantea]
MIRIYSPYRIAPSTLLIAALLVVVSCGCHVLDPRPIPPSQQTQSPDLLALNEEPLEFGKPHKVLDTAGWIWGIPGKVMLWDRRIDNHHITEPTIEATTDYMRDNSLAHVKVRVNQYAPLKDWKRLRANKNVAWPYRYTLGLAALGGEAILPGRLFGGDHYNPFTQTVHLYSDVPAIALHELAHAKDFSRRSYPGTYGAAYLFFPTWHETVASRDVFSYLYQRQDREGIIEANRILYPAYGTYVGSGLGSVIPSQSVPLYYGTVIAGHINGRMLSRDIDEHLAEYRYLFGSGVHH